MNFVSATAFATAYGITPRAARNAFRVCGSGGMWRGEKLAVLEVAGCRGGAGGKVWALRADLCSQSIKEALSQADTVPECAIVPSRPDRVDDRHVRVAVDRQRIIAPALATPPRSADRKEAIRAIAAQDQHQIAGNRTSISERTIYAWIKAVETNTRDLLPIARRDRGQHRVRISRAWDNGCGLSADMQDQIASKLEATARGLFLQGRSERNTVKLCSNELRNLTIDAGVSLPPAELKKLCKVTKRWAGRYREMKAAHAFARDNKSYTDKHEYHVKRSLTARPMEVLMGDVHTVDLTISEAISSKHKPVRELGFKAALAGEVTVKAWLIAWMDGSSGYIWATPVVTGPGQGITQQDVALSLYDVLTCPWGGMPGLFMLDGGSEYSFMVEAVTRFASMAEMSSLGVVKCKPYHPEGKARLEGAFGVITKGFISALEGYNGGNFLKPRLQGRGQLVDPYNDGAQSLINDLHLAVDQYNGTEQNGDLNGYSPKAMLEAKAETTDWQAQCITPENDTTFDLVFSREITRDVRQGTISHRNRRYSAPVLANMIGEKDVSILVPHRDPDGPLLLWRDGVVHQLTHDVFGLNDVAGSVQKSKIVALQRAEIEQRKAKADQNVDVQQMLSDAADLTPVKHNHPATWQIGALDKAGFLDAPISAQDAREREDADARADMEKFLAMKRSGKREVGGCNRRTSPNAT